MKWWRDLKCALDYHDYRLHVHYDIVGWQCKNCGHFATRERR